MRIIEVAENQTLIDIAMQYCGDAMILFELAELNSIEITDDLEIGQQLKVPDIIIENAKTVLEFSSRDLYPSSKDDLDVDEGLEGIDYWAIDDDFIVQ